ncbi:hypothetical protein NMA1209 [Neisseria meningitidis Z2491]|uniref:Uncharacterized protein n=1 Tax=Neisseria meningitidis serogroup A / serotype 4A (strain DSM 15465 / Z2491) TaxID=122587 RepID=A0A0U1RIP0_NEIMA|nr:hypothetical protein NMA1209 [Neisseria meningitidis Z2491]
MQLFCHAVKYPHDKIMQNWDKTGARLHKPV